MHRVINLKFRITITSREICYYREIHKVLQIYIYIYIYYIHISPHFLISSHLDNHRALNRVPCVFSLVVYFIHSIKVYMLLLLLSRFSHLRLCATP